jgi:hypothetical protein
MSKPETKPPRVIVVVRDGLIHDIYSTVKGMPYAEVLDIDNMLAAGMSRKSIDELIESRIGGTTPIDFVSWEGAS